MRGEALLRQHRQQSERQLRRRAEAQDADRNRVLWPSGGSVELDRPANVGRRRIFSGQHKRCVAVGRERNRVGANLIALFVTDHDRDVDGLR